MADREFIRVLCYFNGCVKYGPDGLNFEGSNLMSISVKHNLEFTGLVDRLYRVTGLDRQRSKFDIIGRYPSLVQKSIKYVPLPVVNDAVLETMLEVPSNHPSIPYVELYLEVKFDRDIIGLTAWSSLLANPGGSSKRQRTDIHVFSGSSASKPWSLSNLWVDDNELRVGLCFKDGDELKKAVDWCSIRRQKKCVVHETKKDEYAFECIRWKCNWSLRATRMGEHGLVEIIKCSGPHTCCSIGPENFDVEFAAEEIECLIRVQPTLRIGELNNWWFEKYSCMLATSVMEKAKLEAMRKIYGDWDQSFRVLPKLMAALQSSNGLVVDWQYDLFPNSEFASFRGVFWAFPQSIQGFTLCRPVIEVDSKDLSGKYPMKLMIASGVDAANKYFPLAFAVTTEVSTDSWRWFLSGIREKVTQRKELCLISSRDPDIVAVINEPGSLWKEPWAYHRFSLDQLCSQFYDIFKRDYLTNLVEKAGLAMQQVEFDTLMEDIRKKNPEARRWLDQMPPHQWAIAHDRGWRYGVIEEMFFIPESFQSLDLPLTATVLLLFNEMRALFLGRLADSKFRLKCGDGYSKPVMDKLEEFMSVSIAHVIMPLENGVFQVTTPSNNDDEWIVQLSDCTCTCGKFQSCKFPCLHALAVCKKLKINPLQYVDDCYTLDRYHKTYAATFSPVPEASAWPEASDVPTFFPPPPPPPPKVSVEEDEDEDDEDEDEDEDVDEDEEYEGGEEEE